MNDKFNTHLHANGSIRDVTVWEQVAPNRES